MSYHFFVRWAVYARIHTIPFESFGFYNTDPNTIFHRVPFCIYRVETCIGIDTISALYVHFMNFESCDTDRNLPSLVTEPNTYLH